MISHGDNGQTFLDRYRRTFRMRQDKILRDLVDNLPILLSFCCRHDELCCLCSVQSSQSKLNKQSQHNRLFKLPNLMNNTMMELCTMLTLYTY